MRFRIYYGSYLYWPGECGSLKIEFTRLSFLDFSHHECPKLIKNNCSGLYFSRPGNMEDEAQ